MELIEKASEMLTSDILSVSILYLASYFCSFITFFKIQLCLKHYGGQCKHTEFTCYAGVETCIQIFRIKGLWGQMFQQWPRYDVWCLGESRESSDCLQFGKGREHHQSQPGRDVIWVSLQERQSVDMGEGISASWSIKDTFLKESISSRIGD